MMIKKALLLAFAVTASLAHAQEGWPARPIHFVVPFGPGGANDLVARAVAEYTSRQLGKPIIVDNKPGAGSALGTEFVARSAPDGYTFLAPAAGVITNLLIKKSIGYQEDDLIPVAMLAVSPSVIVVPADSPIKDLKGLVAASKKSGGLNFSTAGTGSTPHFVGEMLHQYGGAKMTIIPYKSGAEGVLAVLSKQVDATSEGSPVVLPQIAAGKLRPLASTWSRRIAALPDLPTAQELGYKDLVIGHWSGIFAPKGTPDAILDKLNAAINAALKSSELRAKLIPQGIDPVGGSREDFRKFLASEKTRLGAVVRNANMKED